MTKPIPTHELVRRLLGVLAQEKEILSRGLWPKLDAVGRMEMKWWKELKQRRDADEALLFLLEKRIQENILFVKNRMNDAQNDLMKERTLSRSRAAYKAGTLIANRKGETL